MNWSIILGTILSASLVVAQDMPLGLQRVIAHATEQAILSAQTISFFIAFVAGVLGILSPCILPLLPAYFSFAFKEKKDITKMTLWFFAGFTFIFVSLGVIAGHVGDQALAYLGSKWIVTLAGSFILGMGLLSFFGKGFASFISKKKFKQDTVGTILFGVFFALGWTACLGPILGGILSIATLLKSPVHAGILLFFYSLGNIAPLLLLSIGYDSFELHKNNWIKGKRVNLFGKELHTTNMISGGLFMLLGGVMIAYQGTSVFNTWDFLGTKKYFYSMQNLLLENQFADLISFALFSVFMILVGWYFYKKYYQSTD
jgi:cytochrome c biogenesis protein CcdA